jgi:hypothetical protein
MEAGRIIAAVVISLTLSACAPGSLGYLGFNPNKPQAVANITQVTHDDFEKLTIYHGPDVLSKEPTELFLYAVKSDATGGFTYRIYIKSHSWPYYHSAYDSNGKGLQLSTTYRDGPNNCMPDLSGNYNLCRYEEEVVLPVTEEYLKENQETGIRFKAIGERTDQVFFIPPGYIKGFLSVTK